MLTLTSQVVALIHEYGHQERAEPFTLSSGEVSYHYIDGKRAIATGAGLKVVSEAVLELARDLGIEFEAAGGLTMGADPLAHGIAVVSGKAWFSVRKQAKKHGKQKLIEGAELKPGTPVLVVDDVVTTGASIKQAIDAIHDEGAIVALAVALVDRADVARELLSASGVRYHPLATYRDLGIPRVGDERVRTSA